MFDKALATPDLRAKSLRSHALLDMLEGRFGSATTRLEESALVNRAAKETLSEGRDRLFLSAAVGAQGDRAGSLRQLEKSAALFAGSSTRPPAVLVSRVGVAFVRLNDLGHAQAQLKSLRTVVDDTNPEDQSDLQHTVHSCEA